MSHKIIAQLGTAIGEPARAKMLIALMGGKALTASELALEAGITAQTATTHLQKLLSSKLVNIERQGRHKYFRLSGPDVAGVLEGMLSLHDHDPSSPVKTGPDDVAMRHARVCYDHLAGEHAVRLMQHLVDKQIIQFHQQHPVLSGSGRRLFEHFGAPISQLSEQKRPLCRTCLDWSERRHHLAGALGKWLLEDLLNQGWATKDPDSRVIRFSKSGLSKFEQRYYTL